MRLASFLALALLGVAFIGGCSPSEEPVDGGFLPSGGSSSAGTTTTTAGVSSAAGTESTGGASGGAGMTTGGSSPGGSSSGGMSGAGSGNVSGAGGAGGGSTGPQKTTGCGKDPGQPLGQWKSYDVPLDGQTLGNPHQHTKRTIHVRLPPGYDSAVPSRIVYIGVGCQANDASTASYPLWDAAQGGDPTAIYVAMNLPDPATNNNCYDNRAGVNSIEWESLDHDHAFVSDKFCIDNDRVYMGGYSSGGWIANMFSCYFGQPPATPRKFLPNVALRGVMAVAGCWIDGNPTCNGPVAGIWIHDEGDGGANPYSCAVEQKDRLLMQNGCTGGAAGPTEPWGADFFKSGSCVKYTNCPAQYPVIFCKTTTRGHDPQNNNAIPGFTKFVSDIEAAGL
jgi:poly(3-hydroxybutyrate) depolymerase